MDYPHDADGDALRRIAVDSDMSRPMTIEFAVAVPNKNVGERIGELAEARGYMTSIEHDQASNRWTCYCRRTMLATYESVVSSQKELDELSKPLGGFSDGWGTFGN